MCGQFYVDEKDAKTLQKQSLLPSIPTGLIRPTDPAFTWIVSNQRIQGKIMRFEMCIRDSPPTLRQNRPILFQPALF